MCLAIRRPRSAGAVRNRRSLRHGHSGLGRRFLRLVRHRRSQRPSTGAARLRRSRGRPARDRIPTLDKRRKMVRSFHTHIDRSACVRLRIWLPGWFMAVCHFHVWWTREHPDAAHLWGRAGSTRSALDGRDAVRGDAMAERPARYERILDAMQQGRMVFVRYVITAHDELDQWILQQIRHCECADRGRAHRSSPFPL
jgi:hypothetical protein